MPNYYIRADGQSRTKEQLMTMFANQDYPQEFAIIGVINDQNPQSMAWYFNKSFDGQGYSYNQQQVVMHGLPAVGANQYEGVAHIADLVEDCIEFFGPDAVAVNAPPAEQIEALPADNAGANAPQPVPMNMNLNNNMFIEGWGGMGGPQAGGVNMSNLPVYYAGLIPNSMLYRNNAHAPAMVPLLSDQDYDKDLVGEFYSKLVFKQDPAGGLIGYPDEPVGRWKSGMPGNIEFETHHNPNGSPPGWQPENKKGGRRRKVTRRAKVTRRKAVTRRHRRASQRRRY